MASNESSLNLLKEQYRGSQSALAELQPRHAELELERNSLKNQLLAFREENTSLKEKIRALKQEANQSSLLEAREKEIEHLRQKVIELDELVRVKDRSLEDVFRSPTFRTGHFIARIAKRLLVWRR